MLLVRQRILFVSVTKAACPAVALAKGDIRDVLRELS